MRTLLKLQSELFCSLLPGRQPWQKTDGRRRFLKWGIAGAFTPGLVGSGGVVDQACARAEEAIAFGRKFLLSQQEPDGAWRSKRYGGLRHGDALTPIVLLALKYHEEDRCLEKAIEFMSKCAGAHGQGHPVLEHPVYSAAIMLLALPLRVTTKQIIEPWILLLRKHQLSEAQGWTPDDPEYGGWTYSMSYPMRPARNEIRLPLLEANLSATAFAVEALATASPADPAIVRAEGYINRCQNFSAVNPDPRFDDGGFVLSPDYGSRNKAGESGVDELGRRRFCSYGSATADGLRALRACNARKDARRVQAGLAWLQSNCGVAKNCGPANARFAIFSAASSYYYAFSLARALDGFCVEWSPGKNDGLDWREQMMRSLMSRQKPDGSWANTNDALREDEPILATAMAVITLVTCLGVQPPAGDGLQ